MALTTVGIQMAGNTCVLKVRSLHQLAHRVLSAP